MTDTTIFILGAVTAIFVLAALYAFTYWVFRYMAKNPEDFVKPDYEDVLEEDFEEQAEELDRDVAASESRKR